LAFIITVLATVSLC